MCGADKEREKLECGSALKPTRCILQYEKGEDKIAWKTRENV